MRFRVISLRSATARTLYLFLIVFLAAWLVNPLINARSAHPSPASAGIIPVYRVETVHRAMALTINVVWGTQYVPRLLSLLTEAHVKATFMVGGAWAKAHPDLVQTMVKDGMEVGNHGWNHRHPNQLGYQGNVDDIRQTNETVARVAGVTPKVYAPPYGEFNQTVLASAHALGMPLVMWTIDTIDWRPSSSVAYMVNKVTQGAHPGSIVLMHPTDRTVVALPQLIRGLTSQGYRLVTISELLKLGIPRTDA